MAELPQYSELPPSYSDGVEVSVVAARQNDDELDVVITLTPPNDLSRAPVDVCCVIDVSGSMGSEAAVEIEGGQKETHGLTLLDVVSHAMKTIINSLNDDDRLSIVTYSKQAECILPLTSMDVAGQRKAEAAVSTMDPDGATNLWMGLYTGLEQLKDHSDKTRSASVLLLTDGLPNVVPPRGHLPMLRRYRDQNGGELPCNVSTFGFGYDLDSELLREIAVEGGGTYSFIPDSNFVGTTFAHSLAGLVATMATKTQLSIEAEDGVEVLAVRGGHGTTPMPPTGTIVALSSIQFGQAIDVVLKVKAPVGTAALFSGVLTYRVNGSIAEREFAGTAPPAEGPREHDMHIAAQVCRADVVDTTLEALSMALKDAETLPVARAMIVELAGRIHQSPAAEEVFVKALLEDVEGQITEALSRKDWFHKWGRHYLPSLARAHLLQFCNNFKDPGVQRYGGALFAEVRDKIDEIFVALPPPEPSLACLYAPQPTSNFSAGGGYAPAAAPVDMSMYNNRYGGCFAGWCNVSLADGSEVQCANICKGDVVKTGTGSTAKIACIVRTSTQNGSATMVTLAGGLVATPWHPVRVDHEWTFPCQLGRAKDVECDAIWCFVLESCDGKALAPEDHSMMIDGCACVTLGSGVREGVRQHPYWGTSRVVEDLARLRGWEDGRVSLQTGCVKRNAAGEACGLWQL